MPAIGASAASSSQVKSATRTLDIIEYVVSQRRPLVAQEIATALAIPVSSLSYLLSTLVERDYLQREGRRYRAGPGLERLQAHDPGFTLAERVAPLVRTLRVQLNETASFFVRSGWEVEAIVTETSEQALRYAVDAGARAPIHALSAGKAILSSLPDEELVEFFREAELTSFTDRTVIDEGRLRRELQEIRRSGIARTDEEYSLGIAGLGRLVRIDGEPVGALAVAIPKARFTPEMKERATDLLRRTAALLEAA
ncbi:MAG: helix-turn-helix domain-containing protein [Sphingomonadales bacterium]|nr:helix-turn-helix domain-containing protein [Sphingomonadales bacterium]MBD3772027.1 helix-turn-helix domain-containing protein [Paracoccaceae bacterium]